MIGPILKISVAITALLALSGTSVTAGIDKVYKKPDTEKSWGQQLADFVGYSGYQKSYALVVGVSNYMDGGYPDLPTENDALRMRDYLINEAGFDYVHLVTEEKVTPARINSLMLRDFRKRIDTNDRFLFFWSGHGIDEPNAIGGKEGFLPVANFSSIW